MFYKILITIVMAAMLVTSANAQTITSTGMSQGDLVALLQNIVNALGANVGSTYLSVTGSVAPSFSGVLAADGGITVDTNKFTVADGTGNTTIAGTLGVGGNITLRKTTPLVFIEDSADYNGEIVMQAGASGVAIIDAQTQQYNNACDMRIAGITGTANHGLYWKTSEIGFGINDDAPNAALDVNQTNGSKNSLSVQDAGTQVALINSSGNLTLGATDLASTAVKMHAEGLIRSGGSVAGAASSGSSGFSSKIYAYANGANLPVPASGYVNEVWWTTSTGKFAKVAVFSDASTLEIKVQP